MYKLYSCIELYSIQRCIKLYKLYSSGEAWLDVRELYNALQHVYTGSTAAFSTAGYTVIHMRRHRCSYAVHDYTSANVDALAANVRQAASSKSRP